MPEDSYSRHFTSLKLFVESLPDEVEMALVCIARYVSRKIENEFHDTKFYIEKFGKYINELNGGLTVPGDEICQWVIYSNMIFHQVASVVCRNSLLNILMAVAEFHNLDIENK